MLSLSRSFFKGLNLTKTLITFLITTGAVVILTSCGSNAGEELNVAPEEEAHHDEEGNSVEINAAQFRQLDIQLGSVEEKNLTATLKTTGFLKVPPQNKASITSIMGGTVQKILVQEGDYVKKGKTLITLINPQFVQMQQEYLDAAAQLTFTEADYNRQKTLSESNVTAQKTFQQATANYHSQQAKVNALRQQLNLLGINSMNLTPESISSTVAIKSPVNGYVAHIEINLGATVEPSLTLLTVIDNSQLHLDAFIFEQDLPKVKAGQTIDVMLTNLPGKHYDAKIFSIGSAFEGESKSIPVHASIVGDKTGLIEGMSVIANINTGTNAVPAVPSSTIASYGGNDYIFIEVEAEDHEHSEEAAKEVHKEADEHNHKEGDTAMDHRETNKHNHSPSETILTSTTTSDNFHFKRVQVKKGVTSDGFTEISPLEQIPNDAQVVINGSFYLMAMLTNAGEEGHAH